MPNSGKIPSSFVNSVFRNGVNGGDINMYLQQASRWLNHTTCQIKCQDGDNLNRPAGHADCIMAVSCDAQDYVEQPREAEQRCNDASEELRPVSDHGHRPHVVEVFTLRPSPKQVEAASGLELEAISTKIVTRRL